MSSTCQPVDLLRSAIRAASKFTLAAIEKISDAERGAVIAAAGISNDRVL